MTVSSTPCPACKATDSYELQGIWNCPHCGHEWSAAAASAGGDDEVVPTKTWRDASGTALKDGDSVTVIKDLKFRGGVVKVGTKVKNIKLVHGDHDIDCTVPGIGKMGLKTEFVRKIAE